MNTGTGPSPDRSEIMRYLEKYDPDCLKYYYDLNEGRIKEKSFEEWENPVCEGQANRLKRIATSKVEHTFFAMDYSHGFTGRGGKLAPLVLTMCGGLLTKL